MRIEDIQVPGKLSKTETELRVSFLEHVGMIPGGEKLKACIQCGTCTGSCPVSYAMDIPPRELIALFRAGDLETIFRSNSIWTCASCYACQVRCPAAIKITDIIYALKQTAMERKIYSRKFPVHAIYNAFMKNMRRFGRLNEPRLMTYYFLISGFWKAFAFLPLAFRMAVKGRLDYRASKIKDIKNLRKILKAAEQLDMPVEYEVKPYMESAVGYKAVG
ncbi:MAG: 4Fe-4S dicluster domain-containing protein [Calditrichaeota bacterium]|nr:4Fe-4S dicluster domain-containing protein [Calditrichota bacterium]MCB0314738.1 4Fe-4S dicluster domain-containing protein [Calditrichota bacterium]MCB9090313.1 4Fe-4S dicluster domain-containing protein [Calditrichia bacterium]